MILSLKSSETFLLKTADFSVDIYEIFLVGLQKIQENDLISFVNVNF